MTLSELYSFLSSSIEKDTLTLDAYTADGMFCPLLCSLLQERITIGACSISLSEAQVTLSGRVSLPVFSSSVGKLPFFAVFREDAFADHGISQVFSITAEDGTPFGTLIGELYPSSLSGNDTSENYTSCLFDSFLLYDPVLSYTCTSENLSESWTFTGYACCPCADDRWDPYRFLLPERMPYFGTVSLMFPLPPVCSLEFTLQTTLHFPIGTVVPSLVMNTVKSNSFPLYPYETKAFLSCRISFLEKETSLYIRLFEPGESLGASAVFTPPLSLGSITGFMQSLFGTGGTAAQLLLPEDTLLSSFGLKELHLTLSAGGKNFTDKTTIERAITVLSLAQPIALPIPGLTLDQFLLSWDISWYGRPKPLLSLFAAAKASLVLGDLKLTGDMTGYFPMLDFTGTFTLEEAMSLDKLASAFHTPLPSEWGGQAHTLAVLDISASGRSRTLSVSGGVSDVLTIRAGGLALSLDQLYASTLVAPDRTDFSLRGIVLFKPEGYDPFSFTLSAKYTSGNETHLFPGKSAQQDSGDWIFTGELSSGEISIGALLLSLFKIHAEHICADVILEDLSVSYSTNESRLTLYASFRTFWFRIFGITPSLGGRIKLLQDQTTTDVSAAFYLDVDIFRFLVQADHFYSEEERTFLFRLEFGKTYIQAVYQNTGEDEIVLVMLGGVTLGDMVLALIRLINPNARTSLPSPWDVLDQIRLSDFALRINVTKKTAALLYHVNLNIAGLMRIDDIGLSYSPASGVEYILTGQLLTEKYTIDEPLSWNAMTEAPPSLSATDEAGVRLFYLGAGNHLDLEITEEALPDILSQVKEQLTPVSGLPTAGYLADSGWLFGIDMELSDLFRVRVLLYSPKLYGALLEVRASEKSPLAVFNGLLLELYYKKISDSTGMFHCRLVIPERFADLELGVVHLHLGQLLLEIYTNGSFYLDLGFPHGTDFSSSFGLSFGIFGGRGGVYFATLTGDAVSHVPETSAGVFTPVIRLGIGLTAGIMRSFDLGIVKGGVSLTLTGIFEGVFSIFHPHDPALPEASYYSVRAIAGASGSLFLTVDFKIITVSAYAAVSAFCDLALTSHRKAEICLTLELELSASIKILFFKISFSFHFRQQVSFTFGSDSIAPWETGNAVSLQDPRPRTDTAPITVSTSVGLESRQISPSVVPLCSVIEPQGSSHRQFCEVFLTLLDADDFRMVMEFLTEWILSHFPGDHLTVQDAGQLRNSDLPGQLTYEGITELLTQNMTISLHFADVTSMPQNDTDKTDGVFFPMLPWLVLHVNDTEIDFASRRVTEEDMYAISEYFYQLNPDPSCEFPAKNGEGRSDNEDMPLCGAILTDWFHMAASELTGQILSLFDCCPVKTEDLSAAAAACGAGLDDLLYENPGLILQLDRLPYLDVTIRPGDTLEELQNAYSLTTDSLWQDVKDLTMLPTDTVSFSMDGYCFDNRIAGLTAAQACALFYVRLFPFEPFYASFAEYLISHNNIDEEWICRISGEFVLGTPAGSYIPSCGDTVTTISKMLCLLENGCEDVQWAAFQTDFLSHNPAADRADAVLDTYMLFGSYSLTQPHSIGRLFLACYPDLSHAGQDYRSYSLWSAEILRPLSVITLHNALMDISGTAGDLTDIYGMTAVCAAFGENAARLEGSQTVNVRFPLVIAKETLTENVLSPDVLSAAGSVLSRAFLQGSCPPAPGTREETPLYELLGQQFLLPDPLEEQRVSLSLNASAPPMILPPAGEMILTVDQLARLLPEGELTIPALPSLMPSVCPAESSWSLAKGSPILSSEEAETLYSLPKDCIRYITTFEAVPELSTDADALWCTELSVTIRRSAENVYYMWGVRADDRELLYTLSSSCISRCRLFYIPSRLDTGSAEPCDLLPETCFLVKTNLSTETHYGLRTVTSDMAQENSSPYIASLSSPADFLQLLWECSVIGGGFWFYMDASLPDSVFSEDGSVSLKMIVIPVQNGLSNRNNPTVQNGLPADDVLPFRALNAVLLRASCRELSLTGSRETIMVPALPAGCAGLSCNLPYQEEGIQSLYQLLAYEVYSPAMGKKIQSSPILPRSSGEGSLACTVAVPLWKLCDTDAEPYAWVGQSFDLTFFLRDVLGNSISLGVLSVTGEYNDTLHALGELPCTRWNYGFTVKENNCLLEITGSYTGKADNSLSGVRNTADPSEADRAAVDTTATILAQVSCPNIRLTAHCSLKTSGYDLTEDCIDAVRRYISCLYRALTIEGEKAPDPVVLAFPIDRRTLPSTITLLRVSLTLERTDAANCAPCIRRAESDVLTWEDGSAFSAGFCSAFDEIPAKLALDQSELPYYVPVNALIGKLSIIPYAISTPGGSIHSPEFFAPAPLSNERITRECKVYGYDKNPVTKTFADIDVNLWERQFLSDIEALLSGETVCRAARICPHTVQTLADAKEALAEALCKRFLPVSEDAAPVPEEEILALAEDRLKSSLNLLYDTAAAAVFRSEFTADSDIRLEPYVDSPHVLSASKLYPKHKTFCLFFSETGHRQTQLAASVSFPNIEYDIQKEGGYESSRWLRFETPVTETDSFADISLVPETEVPLPRRECPLPPVLSEQTGTASDEFLFWDWSIHITCQAYEQYTVYLELSFETIPCLRLGPERTFFDVLADYHYKRHDLLQDINAEQTGTERFTDSLQTAAELAREYALCISSRKKKVRKTGGTGLTLCMQITFTLGDTVTYTIVPDVQSRSLMEQFNIRLEPVRHISEQPEENTLTFQVCLSHLPVYQCRQVTPAAHIIQNDNLFGSTDRKVRDEFIFRTEAVSLPPRRISIHYDPVTVSGSTLAESIHSIWTMLGADDPDLLITLTASYSQPLSPGTLSPAFITPVTLIPDAAEKTVANVLEAWKESSGFPDDTPGRFLLDITVFEKKDNYPIVYACFEIV